MRGLTLVEIIISIFLLVVAVLGLIGVRLYTARAEAGVPYRQTASLIAATQMTEVEDRLRGGARPEEVSLRPTQHPQHPRFEYEIEASPHPAFGELVMVDVRVRWDDRGRSQEYKLHSRFTGL